jgi:hypothetical protein
MRGYNILESQEKTLLARNMEFLGRRNRFRK